MKEYFLYAVKSDQNMRSMYFREFVINFDSLN